MTIEAGIFPIDKPVGPTSFRVVQQVRRALGIKKTGHAGTLDPFASGLLVVCVGRPATRLVPWLMDGEKVYEAELCLGLETETFDLEGEIVARNEVGDIGEETISRCLASFTGSQLQVPPLYSALKHKGKPLYYYARKGIEISREARKVEIPEIKCLDFSRNILKIKVRCSKGTYIRTLASDIGRVLGCGACLSGLRRLQSGFLSVAEAVDGNVLADGVAAAEEILMQRMITVETVRSRLLI
ncbi:MAG: tRNA pseudouridine(55) synthase TruB [Proteobacteria bacterium]|nr:tRNA pseudouridine(55) synthase TruB [Pseudomonadota bacterium]MBU1737630.1 tRNA pseudouridine(55) synthase TruB [Pseudomonadota bacterium]